MVQFATQPHTLEAFLQLPATQPASEFIKGQVTQKPMPQGEHSTLQGELVTVINAATKPGRVAWAFPELRCTFDGRSIVPDVSVFTWDKLPTKPDGTIANIFTEPPDWIIEILSPEQSTTKLTHKIVHCLKHGTQLGWLINSAEHSVFAYYPDQRFELLDDPEMPLPIPTFAQDLQLTLGQMLAWLRVR
ncbi:Uma2 family endonuclease [Acaryochloris sp. IP29b_bin.148]|uniref:Uma2 family endonuclease n=1 Tax=Acaryochloris sp. IP29b_bin.148 TaxID=2969218 RepID=UPI00261BE965|nr:Uma2 family endonuclease [Acaryochloris sp. IP29b_bin.148]